MRTFILFLMTLGSQLLCAQTISETLTHNGTQRDYLLRVPGNYVPGTPLPLVFVFHGLGDSGGGIMNGTGFNNFSDTANFFVVYPTGLLDNFLGGNSWNNGLNPLNSTDDEGFVEDMIDTISERYTVDSTRIFATGFSMGAFFSQNLACNLNEKFAAVASVSGMLASSVLSACNPPQAIPVLHFHGTADQTIAYDGSTPFTTSSVNASIEHWAQFNNCNIGPDTTDLPDIANDGYTVQRVNWQDCTDSTEAILFIEHNAPHTWLQSNNDIYATAEIWKFFRKHHKRFVPDTSTAIIQSKPILPTTSPNPFSDELVFNFQPIQQGHSISIFNIHGQVVYQEAEQQVKHLVINTTHWPSGVYFILLKSESQQRVEKIIKTNHL